jgi:hypothetical protein
MRGLREAREGGRLQEDEVRQLSAPPLFSSSLLFSTLYVISSVIKLSWITVWSEDERGENIVERLKMG